MNESPAGTMGRKKHASNGSSSSSSDADKPPPSSRLPNIKSLVMGKKEQQQQPQQRWRPPAAAVGPDPEPEEGDSSSSPASSINDGSGGSDGGGRGGQRGPSSLRQTEEHEDEEITPESSPGGSSSSSDGGGVTTNGDGEEGAEAPASSSSPPASPPAALTLLPPSPAPAASPTLISQSRRRQRQAHEAALWSLLRAVKRGEGEGAVVDAALLDRLLGLGRRAFDPSLSLVAEAASSSAAPAVRGDGGLGWFGRLLEAVAESELGSPPCALHRARVAAVFQCAAFFCRLKGGSRRPPRSPPRPQQAQPSTPSPSPSPSSAASCAAAALALSDLPPVCRGELRRRLATLLASLQCPQALGREEVDAMRRDDLLIALRFLESPLAPLDITLRSVLLPLLEGLCKDVLMSSALGEEVTTRLELELAALDEQQQQSGTPGLWRAADSVWRLLKAPRSNANKEADEEPPPQPQPQQQGEQGEASPPPPSQLAADAAPRVARLLDWLRDESAALACRHSAGLRELLLSLPCALRSSLRAQVYEGPGDFIRVFSHHEPALSALSLPPSTAPCLPMPTPSPPRRAASRRNNNNQGGDQEETTTASLVVGGGGGLFRECHRLAPGVAQALKDIGREKVVVDGEPAGGQGLAKERPMSSLVAEALVRRCVGQGEGEQGQQGRGRPKGLEAAVQRTLCAASRTTFGGDVFFIVRDLFGGDGVIVAPLSAKRARGPSLSALEGGWQDGGGESPVEVRVVEGEEESVVKVLVTSRTAYGLYADVHEGGYGVGVGQDEEEKGRRRRRRSLTQPIVTLHATLVETIPILLITDDDEDGGQQGKRKATLPVLARGHGAGRVLKLRAERPPSPCPSPPPPSLLPLQPTYPDDAAAAGGASGGRGGSDGRTPARENDEISV